jgi:hypothetical protein
MYVLLRYVVGFAFVGLMLLDHWVASLVGAVLFASFMVSLWLFGSVVRTLEYWKSTCPKWIFVLFGLPGNPENARYNDK